MTQVAPENSNGNGQSGFGQEQQRLTEYEAPKVVPVEAQHPNTDSAESNLVIPIAADPESRTSSSLPPTEKIIADGMTTLFKNMAHSLISKLVGVPFGTEQATPTASQEQPPAPNLPLTQREKIIAHTRVLANTEETSLKAVMAPVPEAFANIYNKLDHIHEAQNESLARQQKAEELRMSTLLTVATAMFEYGIVTPDDLDLNNDDKISTHEIATFINVLGQSCSPQDLQHLAEAQIAYERKSEALSRAASPVGHTITRTSLERQQVRELHRAHEAFLASETVYTNQLRQIARRVFEPAEASNDTVIYLPPRQPVQQKKRFGLF